MEKFIYKGLLKTLAAEAPKNYVEKLNSHLEYANKLFFIYKAVNKEGFTAPQGFTNPLYFDSHGRIDHSRIVSGQVYSMYALLRRVI